MIAAAPPMTERDVRIAGGICGTVALPATAAQPPCVVLLHGFGGHRNEVGGLFAALAAQLADRGIASLRIDFPGCGESDGDFGDVTIGGYAKAAGEALGFAASSVLPPSGALGLLGYSFGGAIATALLEATPPIRSLALWAPVMEPASDMIQSLGADRAAEAERSGSVGIPWGDREIRLKRDFFKSLSSIAPLEKLAAFEGEILVIAGSSDRLSKHVEAIGRAATRAKRCESVVIEGADHFFGALQPGGGFAADVTARTAAFFAETLAAR